MSSVPMDMSAPPPAYEMFKRSDEAARLSMETLRLRNFISFCLTMDYRAFLDSSCSCSLSSADRDHFVDLYETTEAMRKTRGTSQGDDRVLAPYVQSYLHEPRTSLGIPRECAQQIVARFAVCLDLSRRYEGCAQSIVRIHGMQRLAKKLWTDRQLLIPRLGKSEQMQFQPNEALLWTARLFFVSVDGSDSTLPVLMNFDTVSREEAKLKYTLSRSGNYYSDHAKLFKTGKWHVVTRVVGGIMRLLRMNVRPASRLPIFPESSPQSIYNPIPREFDTTQAVTWTAEPSGSRTVAHKREYPESQARTPREFTWHDFDSTAA